MKTTVAYEQATLRLEPRDTLVLFTDGVSEAMSRDFEEFGEQRLEAALLVNAEKNAAEIIRAVHLSIVQFAKDAAQSDDITMMVVKVL
jgi:sigma-B regulation protein RsbU (phosphoserine phosphatase)